MELWVGFAGRVARLCEVLADVGACLVLDHVQLARADPVVEQGAVGVVAAHDPAVKPCQRLVRGQALGILEALDVPDIGEIAVKSGRYSVNVATKFQMNMNVCEITVKWSILRIVRV